MKAERRLPQRTPGTGDPDQIRPGWTRQLDSIAGPPSSSVDLSTRCLRGVRAWFLEAAKAQRGEKKAIRGQAPQCGHIETGADCDPSPSAQHDRQTATAGLPAWLLARHFHCHQPISASLPARSTTSEAPVQNAGRQTLAAAELLTVQTTIAKLTHDLLNLGWRPSLPSFYCLLFWHEADFNTELALCLERGCSDAYNQVTTLKPHVHFCWKSESVGCPVMDNLFHGRTFSSSPKNLSNGLDQ